MKKLQLTTLIIILVIICSVAGFTQNVEFTYDDTGNRISRALVVLKITTNNDFDEFNKDSVSLLGKNEPITINNVGVSISPNPNGGKFEVKIGNLNENTVVDIYLHALEGKFVYKRENANSINEVDISNCENGTYILTLIVNGTKETWKIIKQ